MRAPATRHCGSNGRKAPRGRAPPAPRFTEARALRMRLLEQAQRREQREAVRLVAQAIERIHSSCRAPVRTGQRFNSPRAAERTRVWANELSDTWRAKN